MPTETQAQMRLERIGRLLSELEYEITRGVMKREIEPDLHFSKIFPCPGRGSGLAALEIHVYPAQDTSNPQMRKGPRLRVIEGGPDAD